MRPSIRRCALCKEKHLVVGDGDTLSQSSSHQCVFCGLWWHSACVDKLFVVQPGYTKCFADSHGTLLEATKKSCPNPKQYDTSWWDMLLGHGHGHMPTTTSGSGPTPTSLPSSSSSSPVPTLMRKRLGPLGGSYRIPNIRDSRLETVLVITNNQLQN